MNYIAQSPVISLDELTHSQCRFPVGDPCAEDFGFCGSVKRHGSPYCERHHCIAYTTDHQPVARSAPQIAASWTVSSHCGLRDNTPITVWRPQRSTKSEINLPSITQEDLVAAHKQRQAKLDVETRRQARLEAEREARIAKARKEEQRRLAEEQLRLVNIMCAVSAFLQGAADGTRGHPKRVNVKIIQKAVADYYKVTVDEIVSSRRTIAIMRPRQVAMYLARMLTPNSLPEIGRRFGDRDHTTILHGVQKIAALIEVDPSLRLHIEELRAKLGARA